MKASSSNYRSLVVFGCVKEFYFITALRASAHAE